MGAPSSSTGRPKPKFCARFPWGMGAGGPWQSPPSGPEKKKFQRPTPGFRNRQNGEKLFISEQTVKNHLHNIFDKLGVSDRLELALYAIHHRLVEHELPTS